MELRLFIFEHRIKQSQIIAAGRREGHSLCTSNVSKFVNRVELWPFVKAGIRAGLAELGYTRAEIDKIDELKK